jgi:hypothetical protein
VLGALVTCLLPGRALAQSVVLVRPPVDDRVLVEAFNRLRGELGLQNFEVLVAEAPPQPSTPEAIEKLAQDKHAFAAISFTRRAGTTTADVWIADRATGKTMIRTLALHGVVDAPSVLAVRAVDLLRESLRELEPGESPPPDVVGADRGPVPEQVREWAKPEPPAWRLRLEGTALGEMRDIGLGYGVGIALGRRLSSRFRAGIGVAGPLVGASYRAATGRASVRQELGWVELGFTAYRSGFLGLETLVGLGAYHLEARSEVSPPWSSRSDQVTSALASVGLSLDFYFTDNVGLVLGACGLALTPMPGVAIGPERTLLAQPLVRAFAGLGVDF